MLGFLFSTGFGFQAAAMVWGATVQLFRSTGPKHAAVLGENRQKWPFTLLLVVASPRGGFFAYVEGQIKLTFFFKEGGGATG